MLTGQCSVSIFGKRQNISVGTGQLIHSIASIFELIARIFRLIRYKIDQAIHVATIIGALLVVAQIKTVEILE